MEKTQSLKSTVIAKAMVTPNIKKVLDDRKFMIKISMVVRQLTMTPSTSLVMVSQPTLAL
jgi:hypothetical protein